MNAVIIFSLLNQKLYQFKIAIKRLNPWAGLCECDTFVGGGCAPVQV